MASEDPKWALLYSDLVVQGSIVDVSPGDVPVRDYLPGHPRPGVRWPITNVKLKVFAVLKGYHSGSTIDVVVPGGDSLYVSQMNYNYEIGDEVIVALVYWKYMKGGSYMPASEDDGRFIRRGELWENQGRLQSLSIEAIRAITSEADPSSILQQADVVGVGIVEDVVWTTEDQDDCNGRVQLHVSKMFKGGTPSGGRLTFCIVKLSSEWSIPLPELERGEERFFFLKKHERGFYFPFAGGNGLLKVQGETLILNNRVQYKHSKSELIGIIEKGLRE